MATYLKLIEKPREIFEETFDRINAADETREAEHKAVVLIQSWHRQTLVRCYIRYLNACAVTIQRHWRGFLGRRYCRIRIKRLLMVMRLNHYNAMAVVIQRYWRGHFVRQCVHNFYARKRYFTALMAKNEITRSNISQFIEEGDMEGYFSNRDNYEMQMQILAKKSHHLISTRKIPGIYNSPFRDFPDEMELRLQAVSHSDYLKKKPKKLAQKFKIKSDHLPLKPYPPKDSYPPGFKVQGPFKPLAAVRRQRYKPYRPSVRCETSYFAVEEARKQLKSDERSRQVSDVPFRLYNKFRPTYIGLVHTYSAYDISNKLHLREDDHKKDISKVPIRTVFPSIALFDRISEMYTQGAVQL